MTHPYLKILMAKPGRLLPDGSAPSKSWHRKARRYGRLLKRESSRLERENTTLREELVIPDHHVNFPVNVDGQDYLVLGDPNMSEETRKALAVVIRAAIRWMDDKESGGEDE